MFNIPLFTLKFKRSGYPINAARATARKFDKNVKPKLSIEDIPKRVEELKIPSWEDISEK